LPGPEGKPDIGEGKVGPTRKRETFEERERKPQPIARGRNESTMRTKKVICNQIKIDRENSVYGSLESRRRRGFRRRRKLTP